MVKEVIAVPDAFTYEFFQQNRYTISEFSGYQCLCNNGFIKLYTIPTRVYWHTQNQFEHRSPDWKFHVSVSQEHLKKAWNLLVGLFIKMKCRAGMKCYYLRENDQSQKGRQITIYIVKIDKCYNQSAFAGDFDLSISEEHSDDFWVEFVEKAQAILEQHEIITNGVAQGDLKLGKYFSLRNQSFVTNDKGESVYPPNSAGWNPNKQQLPFMLTKFSKALYPKSQRLRRPIFYFMVPVFLVSAGLLLFHKQGVQPLR